MRDAVGGSVSIYIIAIFLVALNGYLAYSVNYTKAFRVKNRIVSILEEYEGHTVAAQEEIHNYITANHYYVNNSMPRSAELEGYICYRSYGYCLSATPAGDYENASDYGSSSETYKGWNYQVVTFVNIDIPVINNLLSLGKYLRVVGETRPVYTQDGTDGL